MEVFLGSIILGGSRNLGFWGIGGWARRHSKSVQQSGQGDLTTPTPLSSTSTAVTQGEHLKLGKRSAALGDCSSPSKGVEATGSSSRLVGKSGCLSSPSKWSGVEAKGSSSRQEESLAVSRKSFQGSGGKHLSSFSPCQEECRS